MKSIGVSNFPITTFMDMMAYAKIKPVVNQVECHPFFNQKKLMENCAQFGIKLQGFFFSLFFKIYLIFNFGIMTKNYYY